MTSGPKERHAVRALLIDEQDCVLLVRLYVPDTQRYVWLTPGGGIEAGEDEGQALVREVWEETGLRLAQSGEHVWNRSQRFVFRGEDIHQHERFYFLRVPRFEPTGAHNPAVNEAELLSEFRWWSVESIRDSEDYFAPRKLGDLLADLLNNGLPPTPVDVGW